MRSLRHAFHMKTTPGRFDVPSSATGMAEARGRGSIAHRDVAKKVEKRRHRNALPIHDGRTFEL